MLPACDVMDVLKLKTSISGFVFFVVVVCVVQLEVQRSGVIYPTTVQEAAGGLLERLECSWCVCVCVGGCICLCLAVDFLEGCWVLPWLLRPVKTSDLRAAFRIEHTLVAMHDRSICSSCFCLLPDFVNWLKVWKGHLLLLNKSSSCMSVEHSYLSL